MPVNTHLQWQEIRDFSAGLWTVTDQLMPATAAQQMDNCYPAPSGGLRAWFKATSFTTTGIGSLTLERPRCLFVHENVTGNQTNDNYLLTYNTSTTVCKLYRMDETTGAVAWSLIKTFAAGNDPGVVTATAYWADTPTAHLYACFGIPTAAAGADHGVWSVRYDTGTVTQQSTFGGFITNYQSRLVCANGASISYTDPGVWTNFATNTATVDVNEGQPNILALAAFSPGDLMVFKEGAPIYLVEGDFLSYTVRQMNGSKPIQIGGPVVARGPQGVIYRVGSDGIYETPDGSILNPLSKALSSQEWVTTEPILWSHHFLLSLQNSRVLDYDSHGWFTYTGLTSGSGVGCLLRRLGGIFFTDNTTTFTINKIIPADGRTDNRAESYTWKSSPMRDPAGNQIEIRAVEIYARSTNTNTSTVAVTVNGVTQTLACDSSGRGALMFYFMARREELDITVTAASNATGVEAPRIECIRFGTRQGHLLVNAANAG